MCLCFKSFFIFVLQIQNLACVLLLAKTKLAFLFFDIRDSDLHDKGNNIINYAVDKEKNDSHIEAIVLPDLPSTPPTDFNRRIVEGHNIPECLLGSKNWVHNRDKNFKAHRWSPRFLLIKEEFNHCHRPNMHCKHHASHLWAIKQRRTDPNQREQRLPINTIEYPKHVACGMHEYSKV